MKKSKKIVKKDEKPIEQPHKKRILKNIHLQFDDFSEMYENIDVTECISESKDLIVKKLVKLLERSYNISFLSTIKST
jgi:predicted glycosyl hydrolase (DUF1957 family)